MGVLSDGDRQRVQNVVGAKEARYYGTLDNLAQGDVCYPNQPTALGKAEAELKARKAAGSRVGASLKKSRKAATEKLKGWKLELRSIEVPGEKNLFTAINAQIECCDAALGMLDTGPMEKIIEVIKNPSRFGLGLYQISSLTKAHWGKLSTLLHRVESFDALVPAIAAGAETIERCEQVVRGNIASGKFRLRPGSAARAAKDQDGFGSVSYDDFETR